MGTRRRVKTCFRRAETHQSKARWGNPLSVPLSECTRSGSGGPVHWTGHLSGKQEIRKDVSEAAEEGSRGPVNGHVFSLRRFMGFWPNGGSSEGTGGVYARNARHKSWLPPYVSHLRGATMPRAQRPRHDVSTGAIGPRQNKRAGVSRGIKPQDRSPRWCGRGPPTALAFTGNKP